MSENKALYIDKLLDEIKSLYESVLERKNSESLPFSFLEESFNRIQDIEGLLHKLEYIQVDDLKKQMERLVVVLSENERRVREAVKEKEKEKEQNENIELLSKKEQNESQPIEQELIHEQDEDLSKNDQQELLEEQEEESSQISSQESFKPELGFSGTSQKNKYAEGLVLPKYENPYKSKDSQQKNSDAQFSSTDLSDEKNTTNTIDSNKKSDRSINDKIKTLPTVVDLNRGFSLNDKFLFQRELFGNSRQMMDSTIEKLNELSTYEEVESYIKENVSSDMDDPIVADFLSIIKKGFK